MRGVVEQPEGRKRGEQWLNLLCERKPEPEGDLPAVAGSVILGLGVVSVAIDPPRSDLRLSNLTGVVFVLWSVSREAASLLYESRRRLARTLQLFSALVVLTAVFKLPVSIYLSFGLLAASIFLVAFVGIIVLLVRYSYTRIQRGWSRY